jgi:hypothetical protein
LKQQEIRSRKLENGVKKYSKYRGSPKIMLKSEYIILAFLLMHRFNKLILGGRGTQPP